MFIKAILNLLSFSFVFLQNAKTIQDSLQLIILAIARRRRLLNDEVLIALAEPSWKLLDVSGSDITDHGLTTIAKICTNLHAVDIRFDTYTSLLAILVLLFTSK